MKIKFQIVYCRSICQEPWAATLFKGLLHMRFWIVDDIDCTTWMLTRTYQGRVRFYGNPPVAEGWPAHQNLLARAFAMEWSAHFTSDTTRVAVLASKEPHCLFDLLCRAHGGELTGAQVALVISNHPDLEATAAQFKVPFFFCPVESSSRRSQEREITRLLAQHHVQVAVLARYMQILSSEMLDETPLPIINIHHAFLPAFQGAGPYRRAWERGVKMIGATAHYVTAALDEGPIIEQDVERVTHEESVEALQNRGRDIERVVEKRILCSSLNLKKN
jgi:formyltetrahydrofolate deformylase